MSYHEGFEGLKAVEALLLAMGCGSKLKGKKRRETYLVCFLTV